MKAAIVYHFFPHYRAAVLRELLKSPEHDYVLVADDKAIEPSIEKWDVDDRSRFWITPCKQLFSSLLFQKGLFRLALRRDLDVMVYLANPYFLSTWISALAARLTGKRVLFWTHGWTRDEHGLKGWLRSIFYKLSHGLLLYGHFAKMSGLANGFSPSRLHVIYNSLDYENQRELRAGLRTQDRTATKCDLFERPDLPMVICSARLTPACQFNLLLAAQARLRDQGHLINVLLVGDGPEKVALQEQARRLKLPVKFFGPCYDESTLARLTFAAAVTVSPGKVGLTAIQSLAFGTPVITHDDQQTQMPEWEAIIAGRTGDLFRRGNSTDLARVIKKWTTIEFPDAKCRADCYRLLDRFYNPVFQRRAIDRAVRGQSADDLFWMKEMSQCGIRNSECGTTLEIPHSALPISHSQAAAK
jgi:glycosyltransferase involved in cell wall biosynthesis